MTAPITPDERAAMRERYEPGPMGSPERTGVERKVSQGLTARVDVPRLLDALDTAEAERDEARAAIARRRALWEDERATWSAALALDRRDRDEARAEVARLLAERTAAHADDATCASCTHEYVADMERRVEEADAKAERQRDRLRAREEQVRRLRAEVTRLHALVATERAVRPAPVWDEDTVTEDVARALRALLPLTPEPALDATATAQADAVLAVVREHAPVRPDREAVRLAQHRALMPQAMSIFAAVGGTQADYDALLDTLTDAVLALWPDENR